MRILLLPVVLVLSISYPCFSQKIPLINSGEVITHAKALYDSGKYEASAIKLLTVPKRDTNYVYMLSELALTYIADKKYDQAIEACNEALKKPSEFNAHILSSRAVAFDKKGDFDEAVKQFNAAIEKYPFDHTFIYNLGITYYNHKDYEKAEKCFFKVLSFYPFHPGSHFNLARLAMGQGRRTHAAFAMGAYLSINNRDNERLVILNKLFGNELASEEGVITPLGANSCEKLDQIIRSRIAMDKNFDSKIPVDAPVVKQFELIFNQLSLINSSPNDHWVSFYLSFYRTVKEKEQIEPFIYNMISSANNENVKKWMKKNEKSLTQFYTVANEEFYKIRRKVSSPEQFGFKEPVRAWYSQAHRLEALGADDGNDKRQGQWYFFRNNYEPSAEGKYDAAGKKAGVWKYYNKNGGVSSIENYETGEVTGYYLTGEKKERFVLKNDLIDGEVETFYPCGQLHERLNYKAGKRDGKGQAFYSSGQKNEDYNYIDNKIDGDIVIFHSNGVVEAKKKFAAGLLTGSYEEYFPNSKIRSKGEFVKGERNGLWKYYYSNGQLEKSGSYKEGAPLGEWVYYESNGMLSEKRNFDQAGKWSGENTIYYKGKPYNINTYKNNVLVKVVFVDKAGKQLGKFEGSNGTFAVKTFYAQGQIYGEGNYKKGKMDGVWTYYFPEGSKWKEFKYADGLVQGESTEYFKTGAKKYLTHYKDGDYDGYFQEFYINGQVKQEGWFQKGVREQQWLTYYQDGTVESDFFYLNGQLIEQNYDYGVDGKLNQLSYYKDGSILDVEDYNTQGKRINMPKTEGTKKVYEVKYASGKPMAKYEIQCGNYSGKNYKMFPNGNVFYSYDLTLNLRNGQYKYNTTDNVLEWGGLMVNGQEEGVWTGYSSIGKLESRGKFFNGERDSIWNYFYPSGKLSSTAYYRSGDRDDVSSYYGDDGTLILEKLFESGQLVAYRTNDKGQLGEWQPMKKEMAIVVNYPSGKKAYEEQFKNGLANGVKRIYYSSGKVYSEYNFKDGDYEGTYTMYHPNGNVAEKALYKDDQLTGTRQFFNEDGSLLKTEEYSKGLRHGSTIRYTKGVKVSEVVFWGGSPEK